ncbi:MAG: PhoD-like phosphatase, partial [Cyanobacteriota bacterium]|nr:PhoD-like phosphatase [Cyanobacteriota bacterium]
MTKDELDGDRLPQILVGPMLRRTEPEAVTVWFALKAPQRVTLRVYATRDGRQVQRDRVLLEGTLKTVPLGQFLHIAAVTAKPTGASRLEPGQIYAYDLSFEHSDETLSSALNATDLPYAAVSYFEHQLPTFALPPAELKDLKLIHCSCNKPHGGGRDVFPQLDRWLERVATDAIARPHQLFLTGDQIYGDDVADPLLWRIREVSRRLLGWEAPLDLPPDTCLDPGKRSELAERGAGFTAMLPNKPEKAKSHLLSWGEYCTMYLLVWSPILWPRRFPAGRRVCTDAKSARQWDREVKAIARFAGGLARVRRVLANIPTYTICDDHDVSDDWYLNREWCDRVASKPLGRQALQHGLLGYALFQAWGNTPEQFAGSSGASFFQAVEQWSSSRGSDRQAWHEMGNYLGMPRLDPQTGRPQYRRDGEVLVLDRDERAFNWYYAVRSPQHEVLAIDTRAWRGYPVGAETHAPPMLLCPQAFEEQLQRPLEGADRSDDRITLVIFPTNLVSLGIIDRVHHWQLKRGQTFGSDVGDSWNMHSGAFIQLLETLTQQRDRLVILSGDIHYSCAVRLTYWSCTSSGGTRSTRASVLAQLTSSATKNAEWMTYAIHTKLKSLFPERTEYWLGWNDPPQQVFVPRRRAFRRALARQNAARSPDWLYCIEWMERGSARSLPWGKMPLEPKSPQNFALGRKILEGVLFLVWRNRWLQ